MANDPVDSNLDRANRMFAVETVMRSAPKDGDGDFMETVNKIYSFVSEASVPPPFRTGFTPE